MKGEMRALGVAHGLLLGMVLAAPWTGPQAMERGIETVFILSAFQIRLADRRMALRPGWRGWTSHIRMAPRRLATWAALAIAALIAMPHRPEAAASTLAAALLGELLLYPVSAGLLPRLSRAHLAWIVMAMLLCCAMTDTALLRLMAAFVAGVSACLYWLRGPDGDARRLAVALCATGLSAFAAVQWPETARFCVPGAGIALALALAHISVIRRPAHHWRLGGGAYRFRPERRRLRLRPF